MKYKYGFGYGYGPCLNLGLAMRKLLYFVTTMQCTRPLTSCVCTGKPSSRIEIGTCSC